MQMNWNDLLAVVRCLSLHGKGCTVQYLISLQQILGKWAKAVIRRTMCGVLGSAFNWQALHSKGA